MISADVVSISADVARGDVATWLAWSAVVTMPGLALSYVARRARLSSGASRIVSGLAAITAIAPVVALTLVRTGLL